MLNEGIREEVEVSPVGLKARPRALVRLVQEISHLRIYVRLGKRKGKGDE